MKTFTEKSFWEKRHESLDHASPHRYTHFADSEFGKYICKNRMSTFFEIGCFPCKNMYYFFKNFGFKVSGIDYSDYTTDAYESLHRDNVNTGELLTGDVFALDDTNKYDVVFSDGFVEHFDDPETLFNTHDKLTGPKGTIIITMPNMTHMQYVLRSIFAKDTLLTHNQEVMQPDIWTTIAEKHGFETVFGGFYKTFDFWIPKAKNPFLYFVIRAVMKTIQFTLRILKIDNIPNKFFSPHILLIFKRA